jgi:hypothetical protein
MCNEARAPSTPWLQWAMVGSVPLLVVIALVAYLLGVTTLVTLIELSLGAILVASVSIPVVHVLRTLNTGASGRLRVVQVFPAPESLRQLPPSVTQALQAPPSYVRVFDDGDAGGGEIHEVRSDVIDTPRPLPERNAPP